MANNPNGKKGTPKHQSIQDSEYTKAEQEYKGADVKVGREVTISTPMGKKKCRVADVAAYKTNKPYNFVKIVQIGKTDAKGNPVQREREAIEDIEAHVDIKVTFIDYEVNKQENNDGKTS